MLQDECESDEEYDSTDMNIVKQLIGLKINDGTEEQAGGSSSDEEEAKTSNILLSSNKIYDFANPSSKVDFDLSHFSRT